MDKPSVLPAICEGKPPVIGGFAPQKAMNEELGSFVDVHQKKKLLNKQWGRRWYDTLWQSCGFTAM